MTTPESPAPQSAGLSEREECPLCEHAWRRHDPEDGQCDAGPPCECGRSIGWMRERIATLARLALADEKGEVLSKAPSAETGQPERATPPSSPAGLSTEEVAKWLSENCNYRDGKCPLLLCHSRGPERPRRFIGCMEHRLATALEATAARLKEVESFEPTSAKINALPAALRRYIHDLETNADPAGTIAQNFMLAEQNKQLVAKLAERERELRDVGNALTRQALDVDALKKKLAAAERVVEAARARLEVWTRETYVGVRDALAAYDATRGQS